MDDGIDLVQCVAVHDLDCVGIRSNVESVLKIGDASHGMRRYRCPIDQGQIQRMESTDIDFHVFNSGDITSIVYGERPRTGLYNRDHGGIVELRLKYIEIGHAALTSIG